MAKYIIKAFFFCVRAIEKIENITFKQSVILCLFSLVICIFGGIIYVRHAPINENEMREIVKWEEECPDLVKEVKIVSEDGKITVSEYNHLRDKYYILMLTQGK
jgi:phosphomevalonate kinase